MRVFLDTNVLVAAFATRGICEDVFRTVLAEHALVTSDFVLTELNRVLVKKLKIPIRKARSVTALVRDEADVSHPREASRLPETDPDDRWVLAAALEGHADVLVTGDRDLLDIADEIPIAIVSPRGFWEKLR